MARLGVDGRRDLTRARRAGETADPSDPSVDEAFTQAVGALRRVASPYHLAQALLDHAEYLAATGKQGRATTAVPEARVLAAALGAAPVGARADRISRLLGIDSPATEIEPPRHPIPPH